MNYAVRFSGPVTGLTAHRVRYGVGPDLICQHGPLPGIKTHSSFATFPTTLSLPFIPFPPLSPACTAPLKPQAAGRLRGHNWTAYRRNAKPFDLGHIDRAIAAIFISKYIGAARFEAVDSYIIIPR